MVHKVMTANNTCCHDHGHFGVKLINMTFSCTTKVLLDNSIINVT